jgi:membrane protein implicated in regulation of membrane protease activity
MNGDVAMGFADAWIWLIFVGAGLFFILMELIIGVETGLDLVFVGSALVIGGLISWPLHSWVWSLVITIVICVAYVFALRQFIKRRLTVTKVKTNIDVIIGKKGIVLKDISSVADGRVRVGNERWRARADTNIKEGEEINVTGVSGATLIVEKTEGGD